MWNKILGRRLQNSIQITKLAISITRQNKKLFAINFVGFSTILAFCVGAYAVIGTHFDTITRITSSGDAYFPFPVISILATLIGIGVGIFGIGFIQMLMQSYTTAITLAQVRGQSMSIREAMRITHAKLWPLTQFMFMNMTVGVFVSLLNSLDDYLVFLGTITSAITETIWGAATFFTTPLIIDNQADSGMAAVKKSGKVLLKSFGENVYVQIGVGHILGLLLVGILGLGFTLCLIAGALTGSDMVLYLTASGVITATYIIMVLMLTCNTVIATVLYEYAEHDNSTLALHKGIFAAMMTRKSAAKVFSA